MSTIGPEAVRNVPAAPRSQGALWGSPTPPAPSLPAPASSAAPGGRRPAVAAASVMPCDRGERLRTSFRLGALVVGLFFAGILLEGIRMDFQGNVARLVSAQTAVTVFRNARPVQIATDQPLDTGDLIATGENASAILAFADGTAIKSEAWTGLAMRQADRLRGGRRERSFFLTGGTVFLRSGRSNGGGENLLCTPGAVAAGRAASFRVRYDPGAGRTVVAVADGTAFLQSAAGRIPVRTGQCGIAESDGTLTLRPVDEGDAWIMHKTGAGLRRFDPPVRWFAATAQSAWKTLLSAAVRAGIPVYGLDAAKRAQTALTLKRLGQEIAGRPSGELPARVNPVTLAELGVDPTLRDQLLKTCAGMRIDRYETGEGGFALQVRARDSVQTVYRLGEDGVKEVGPSIR